MKEILRTELDQVLRTGPFSVALHLAIEANGSTLESLQRALLARGVGVSLATLSYWRRGRSRPERPSSIRAVGLLEDILDVPSGSLLTLLTKKHPVVRVGGRRIGLPPEMLWDSATGLSRVYADLAVDPQDQILRVAIHDDYTLGADRRAVSLRTRLLVMALAERTAYCRVVYWTEPPVNQPPVIGQTLSCRAGRVRSDPDSGFCVVELVLDRVLAAGEYAALEFELLPSPGQVIDEYSRRLSTSLREYVLSVRFAQSMLPARCFRLDRRHVKGSSPLSEEILLGASGTAQLIAMDVAAGIVGIRWTWG